MDVSRSEILDNFIEIKQKLVPLLLFSLALTLLNTLLTNCTSLQLLILHRLNLTPIPDDKYLQKVEETIHTIRELILVLYLGMF